MSPIQLGQNSTVYICGSSIFVRMHTYDCIYMWEAITGYVYTYTLFIIIINIIL